MSVLDDKFVMINNSDFFKSLNPALINLFGINLNDLQIEERREAAAKMDDALGVNMARAYHTRPTQYDEPLPPEWREFFQKLAGPNGKFILKTYQAKRGILK